MGTDAHWVDLEEPFFAWLAEIDVDLLVGEVELFHCDLEAVSPQAVLVSPECYLGGGAVGWGGGGGHDQWIVKTRRVLDVCLVS